MEVNWRRPRRFKAFPNCLTVNTAVKLYSRAPTYQNLYLNWGAILEYNAFPEKFLSPHANLSVTRAPSCAVKERDNVTPPADPIRATPTLRSHWSLHLSTTDRSSSYTRSPAHTRAHTRSAHTHPVSKALLTLRRNVLKCCVCSLSFVLIVLRATCQSTAAFRMGFPVTRQAA